MKTHFKKNWKRYLVLGGSLAAASQGLPPELGGGAISTLIDLACQAAGC